MREEIIRLLNNIGELYEVFNLEISQAEINLKSKQVKDIQETLDQDFRYEFLSYLIYYRLQLNELNLNILLTAKQNFRVNPDLSKKINFSYRVKRIESTFFKLERYMQKSTGGRVSINKCLNDLMGHRFIIEFDEGLKVLKNYVDGLVRESSIFNIKRFRIFKREFQKSQYSYKAVHIIYYNDNHSLPWEIQFWRKKDEQANLESHKKFKQNHFELKKRLDSVECS